MAIASNSARGLLAFSSDIAPESHVEAQVPSSGGEQALKSVASDFSAVGEKIGSWADAAAKEAGKEAGHQAGLDPEFRPQRDITLYSQAFSEAGLNVYKTQKSIAMEADLAATYDKHRADPAALAKELDEKRAAWVQNTLPDVQPDIQLSFDKHRFTYMREARRTMNEQANEQNKGALQAELAQSLKQIQNRGYSLGLDKGADEVLTSDMDELGTLLQRRGLDGKPLVAPTHAAEILEKAKTEVAYSRTMGAFTRLPAPRPKTSSSNSFRRITRAARVPPPISASRSSKASSAICRPNCAAPGCRITRF